MTRKIEREVADHYSRGGLYERIVGVLAENGVAEADIQPEHIRGVDEFHMGGAAATEHLLDPLELGPGHKVLDIGCGIGGPARHIARAYGSEVTGIDLTPDFVETARKLTDRLGQRATFEVASALDLPFADAEFDAATLLHVGMNLPDKPRLFAEAARVLKPGAIFAVYDVMLFGTHPEFPVPWATHPETSFLEPPDVYLKAAEDAGFTLTHRADRGNTARTYFDEVQRRMAEEGPPRLGLPLIAGASAPQKIENMVRALRAGDVAPVEMVFRAAT